MDALETDGGRKSILRTEVGWEMLPIGNADIRPVGISINGASWDRVCEDERLDVAAFVLGEFSLMRPEVRPSRFSTAPMMKIFPTRLLP